MRTLSCIAFALAALTAGCGGDGHTILDQFEAGGPLDPGEARMSGNFGAGSFNPSYSWSDRVVVTDNGYQFGVVMLADDPEMCNGLQQSTPTIPFGTKFVLIQMAVVTGTVDFPTQPGDFEIAGTSGNIAFVTYLEVNPSSPCGFAEDIDLASGTLTLDVAQFDQFTGSFAGETAGGNDVSGAFNPNGCSLSEFYNDGFACQ